MQKVSIIGAGNVGGLCAARIAELGIAEVALLDIERDFCQAKVLDIQDSLSFPGLKAQIKATTDYADIKDSQVVVITAGLPRRPGMTRDDLLAKNILIVKETVIKIKEFSPEAIIVLVTNPVDVLTYLALQIGKFDSSKVLGMGVSLDNARFKSIISDKLKVAARSIDSLIIGQHGDTMLILSRLAKINGVKLETLVSKQDLALLIEKTKNRGKEIVNLFKTGSAYFAPSFAVSEIVKSIILNKNTLIPVSVYAKDTQGVKDICIGLPAILGGSGIKETLDLELNAEEKKELEVSARSIKTNIIEAQKFL